MRLPGGGGSRRASTTGERGSDRGAPGVHSAPRLTASAAPGELQILDALRLIQASRRTFQLPAQRHNSKPVADLDDLAKARSMLILLLATCKQSLLALEAAANALDTELTRDLEAMITRSETELVALNAKIEALGD